MTDEIQAEAPPKPKPTFKFNLSPCGDAQFGILSWHLTPRITMDTTHGFGTPRSSLYDGDIRCADMIAELRAACDRAELELAQENKKRLEKAEKALELARKNMELLTA